MQEMMYISQLTQMFGGGHVWLQLGYLVCLFAVLLFRPERIQRPRVFNYAWAALGMSIILPPSLMVLLSYIGESNRSGRGGLPRIDQFSGVVLMASASGPVLFGASVLLGFAALAPPRVNQIRRPPTQPTTHPLD